MSPKRKELVAPDKCPAAKNKRVRREKTGDCSDDEDLSDNDDGGEIFNGIRIPAELPPVRSAEENLGPRMVIKQIVANNFKSYYGEVTVGPFHKSLTSIVGANGSGKSNVIDSLLFVFGYRSTKIRSKKVSVLLHKSDRHKDVRQCSVTVHFVHIRDDDTQETGFVAIPGTEITITRTAFKDNSSFYTLNNKRVKFKDVATILKTNGIDLKHNRFLILQGEVEQIAMMKPKAENEHSTGMLEYLEDVIGTVRYKKPIEKLEEKVKDLSLEKNEKITRMKYVLKERDELEEPAKEVIEYIKMKNVLTRMGNTVYQKQIYDFNKIATSETETLNKISDEMCAIDNELKVINESKKGKDGIVRDLTEKLKAEKKKHDSLQKKIQNSVKVNVGLKNDSLILKEQIKKYENSLKQEQKKITKAKGVPKAKEAERERLQSQLAPLEKECTKLEAEYTKLNSDGFEKSKKFREEKDDLAPEEFELQQLVGSKNNQFQTLKTEFEVLLDIEKSEKEKLNKLEDQLSKGTDEFEKNMRQKEKAEIDIQSSRDAIKDMERCIEKLKNDEQQIKTNLQNIRESLNEKRTAYAETTGRSRPIQYILTLKDKKEVHGILGRCGDYGRVEDKYDIPACTACGSTDQIVVDTSDAAHACIQRLRTNNIGRLTFSILPQVQKLKPRADAKNSYPENATRVFDCIEILDQRFRLTFYSGLHDTLLASNIEQARRIAFGSQVRYRVVTFKGDLIDQSGIMSGGGRPIKGKIGPQETKSKYASGNTSQVSQNEVEKLDKHVKDLEVKLRETQTKIFDIEADIREHRKRIEELNVIIRQCSMCINGWKEKEGQVKQLIKDQKLVIVKKKTDPVAVANKEAEIKKAEKELEDAKVNYDKIKSKVDKLTKKIKEITEEEPKEAKRLLDEATIKLEKTRSAINQVDVDILAAERQIKKSEGQINSLTNDINEANAKEEFYVEKFVTFEKLNGEMNKQLAEIDANIKEQEKLIEDLKNKNDENFHRGNELRKNRIQLVQDLDEIKKKLNQTLEKVEESKTELSVLQLKPIPKISCAQRDPVLESYQNRDAKSQSKVMVDKENNKEQTEKLTNYQKIDCLSEMDIKEIHGSVDTENNDTEMETELYQFTDEQLENLQYSPILTAFLALEEKLTTNKPNFSLLDEYIKRTSQYHEKADEVAEVLRLYNDHVNMVNKVRQRRRDEFMASFRKITIKLKEMYQMITLGGDAELELVDSLDPFSEGVNFSVRPPKKTWKVISNLSGGEKTLSSLALVFALHYYKPSPLYVMDEIDAALDFKNVSIIAYYIKERTKNSQFIIISLRSNMFEKANLLVGIYKTNDCTETASVTTNEYKEMLDGELAKYHHEKL